VFEQQIAPHTPEQARLNNVLFIIFQLVIKYRQQVILAGPTLPQGGKPHPTGLDRF